MKRFLLNKLQITVLIVGSVILVLILTGALILNGEGEKNNFKPLDTPSTFDKATQDKSDNGNDSLILTPNPMTDSPKELKARPTAVSSKNTTDKITIVQGENLKPTAKLSPNGNPIIDKPRDKPDTKPDSSKETKIVPDSQNPFKNAPSAKVDEKKGSDFYQNGVAAGQGDKF